MRQGLTTSEAGKLGGIEAAKTAGIRKQQRIDQWNSDPKLCKFCNLSITYENRRNDFCNHSCSAAFNNKGIRRHGEEHIECENCLFCSKLLTEKGQHQYCSRECMFSFHWEDKKAKLLSSGIDNSSANKIGKKYLIELHDGKCQVCGLSEWQNKPMPLVLDHIDGNAYNNHLVNLRIICNNCDALSPTFKSKNKGSGRFKRALRYKYEKELVGNIEGFKWKQ